MDGDVPDFHDLWLAASAPAESTASGAPRIAGRKEELTAVRRHLETGSGLLLVTGEAGLGKTRLVSTAVAAVPDVFVAAGTCLPLSTDVPLLPIGDLLRAAYDVDGGQWLEKSFGDCAAYVPGSLSRLLPELAPWAEPDPETDGWARERLFSAVGATLRALAANRRLGLLVEDLHWADASTLDLLEHLLCRGIRVPIVGTFRLDDPATGPATEQWRVRIMRLAQVTTLELRPLSRDDTAEQLTLLLGRPADRHLVDRIHRRAQGQPLFAEQLLARSGEDDQPLPRLLSDLLDQRLDRISETASAVAVALGVAGRSLGDPALRRITGLSGTDLTAALRELDRARLLDSATGPGDVQLRHPLLAEAIRRRLIGGETADAHRRVATALADSDTSSPAEIASHWQSAGDREQELIWRIRAAEQAGSLHAVAQQADHWLRALELWPDAASSDAAPSLSRARVSLNAMECLRDAGQMPRALALADRVMQWLPEMSTEEAADLFYRAGYYRGETEDSVAGLELLERSIALYGELPPCRGMVLALELKAMELAALGRRDEAAAALYRGWAVCEELGDPHLIFGLLPTIAWHEALAGDLPGALARLERARRAMASPGPTQELWMGVCHTDMLLIHSRPVAEVEAAGSRALEAARAWGIENSHAAIVHANLAEAMLRAGQVGRAGALLDPVTDGEVTIDRWFTHNLRALLDVLRGRESAAAGPGHCARRSPAHLALPRDRAGAGRGTVRRVAPPPRGGARPPPADARAGGGLRRVGVRRGGLRPGRSRRRGLRARAPGTAGTDPAAGCAAAPGPPPRKRCQGPVRGGCGPRGSPGPARDVERRARPPRGHGQSRALGRRRRRVGQARAAPRRGVLPLARRPDGTGPGPARPRLEAVAAGSPRRPRARPALHGDREVGHAGPGSLTTDRSMERRQDTEPLVCDSVSWRRPAGSPSPAPRLVPRVGQ